MHHPLLVIKFGGFGLVAAFLGSLVEIGAHLTPFVSVGLFTLLELALARYFVFRIENVLQADIVV
jgi:hypothetical protein